MLDMQKRALAEALLGEACMTRPWRLVVTGSRAWTDAQVLREALDVFAEQAAAAGVSELIVAHGAAYPKPDRHTGRIPAKSADWLTHRWIHDLPHPLPVREEAHPADWTAPCQPTCKAGHRRPRPKGGSYCPAVGNYRNGDLVAPGADAGLALHLDGSTGTADCIRRMEAADIPVQRIVRRSPTLPAPVGVDSPSPNPLPEEASMIENTRSRDPLIHLLGAMSDGASGYIEGMEKQGQQQILHSDRLPTRSHSDDKEFLDLGFEFGDPDPGDPMFRPAKLPNGWKRRGSDHAMWSYIDDELGRERVSIFYKAAFYDRDAFMSLSSVSAYADKVLHGTVAEPVFDDEWCTRAAFAEALTKMRERAAERVALYEGSDALWAAEELPKCRDELAKIDALIVKYPAVSA